MWSIRVFKGWSCSGGAPWQPHSSYSSFSLEKAPRKCSNQQKRLWVASGGSHCHCTDNSRMFLSLVNNCRCCATGFGLQAGIAQGTLCVRIILKAFEIKFLLLLRFYLNFWLDTMDFLFYSFMFDIVPFSDVIVFCPGCIINKTHTKLAISR